eukprot:4524601-Amphidinium_carterae.2
MADRLNWTSTPTGPVDGDKVISTSRGTLLCNSARSSLTPDLTLKARGVKVGFRPCYSSSQTTET